MKTSTTKTCEKCKQSFECCANNIEQCHCYQIKLSAQEVEMLKGAFKDCLCKQCLTGIKKMRF